MPTAFQTAVYNFKQSLEARFTTPHPKVNDLTIDSPEDIPLEAVTLGYMYDDQIFLYTAYADDVEPYMDLHTGDELIEIPAEEYLTGLSEAIELGDASEPDLPPNWALHQYLVITRYLAELGYSFMLIATRTHIVPAVIATKEGETIGGFMFSEVPADDIDEREFLTPSTTVH